MAAKNKCAYCGVTLPRLPGPGACNTCAHLVATATRQGPAVRGRVVKALMEARLRGATADEVRRAGQAALDAALERTDPDGG